MSKKHKHSTVTTLTVGQIKGRLEKAQREGRFQQALDLAKQLYAQEATPPHRELLLDTYLSRAQQLRQQGQPRDAETVIENILRLAGTEPAWQEKAAIELAACGNSRRALQLLERLPGSPALARILVHAADAALRQGANGRASLPEALHGPFDLIVQAFKQLEAGQEDAVRESLQGIGLTSPFLEWKLFLRGLQAYYQKDDTRALENWSRLAPERVPARLAAPLRYQIDPAFRSAQAPEMQAVLRRQTDRLLDDGLVPQLRNIQKALGEESLTGAFRMGEQCIPGLRRERPELLPRLAACYYWAIIHQGEPRDIERYRKLFGSPADDPQMQRLEALALEERQDLEEAHKFWKQYEAALASHPSFTGELGRRARALVWWHMGRNAAAIPDQAQIKKLPAFLRDDPDRPEPLKPTAEECFKHSLELAPDQLETHTALYEYYDQRDKFAPAEKAARKLLEHFPEHVPTLLALGSRLQEKGKHAPALELFQRALKANPLDRRLRNLVCVAHSFLARAAGEADDFEQVREQYQAALAFDDGHNRASLLCKWSACEFKAGMTERAEELLAQVQAPGLTTAYQMMIESIRFQLAKPLKTRFDKEFTDALAEPPSAAAAVATVTCTAAVIGLGVTYRGQKTHDKKVLTYIDKVPKDEFTEAQLQQLCTALQPLNNVRMLRKYTGQGRKRFPRNPHFPLIEARSHWPKDKRKRPPYWQIEPLLQKAEKLVREMPPGDEQNALLEQVTNLNELLGANDLMAGFMGSPFFRMFDMGDADDPDDDDDF